MRKLLIVLSLFISTTALSSPQKPNCTTHKIYCALYKLSPTLDRRYLMKMSNLIYKYSKQYKLSPLLSVAIFMQESSLGTFKHRKDKLLIKTKTCITEPIQFDYSSHCTEKYEVVRGISDAGVWMFSINTIVEYDMDIDRVINDLDYSTEWHFKILKKKIKLCKKRYGDQAWGCYNSATKKYHARYVKLVKKWLNKIED